MKQSHDILAQYLVTDPEGFSYDFIEHARVGVFLSMDGKVTYANPYLAGMFDYTQEEFLSRNPEELVVPADFNKLLKQAVRTLTNSETSLPIRVRAYKKGGSIMCLEGHCSVTTFRGRFAVFGTVQDVTYKKRADELLQESSKRYKQLLRLLPDPIIVHGEGIVLFANLAALHMANMESERELIGKSIYEFLDPRQHEEIRKNLKEVLHSEEANFFTYRKIYGVLDTPVEMEISSIRIDNYNAKPVILSVLRDVTERKRAEELLIRSEKLSVVGQLAAGVAHEIRNPLTSLKGFVQLLEQKYPRETSYFEIMKQELDRLNIIVNDFMTLAKPHPSQFHYEAVQPIVDGVVSILETQAIMANVTLRKRYANDLPSIYVDANKLKQVLMNLIKNAIEAMPSGGTIDIEANVVDHHEGSSLRIRIRDQGTGIPEHILNQLGEPFLTTKEHGTGLGLSVCQRIIEAHNGNLRMTSNGRDGTTADIDLPIKKRD